MTTQSEIKTFFTPKVKRIVRVSEIEASAGLPPGTLQKALNNEPYRHLTEDNIIKLLPVLKHIGFKPTTKDVKTVTMIARNKQGASVEFKGKSKAEVMRNFLAEYEKKGWKFEYNELPK